jgi:hypothetical protein
MAVLGPGIANATIGRTAWGVVLAVQMAGAVLGGLVVARLRIRRALLAGVAAILVSALPVLALAQQTGAALLALSTLLTGFAGEFFVVAWDLSLQQNVPADRLARVYSFDALGSFLALPLGEMAIGPLAHRYGSHATLLAAAGLTVLATCAALTCRPIRTLTVREDAAAEPAGGAAALA